MPALYIIVIKNIYLIVSSNNKKAHISIISDAVSMIIIVIQTLYFNHFAGISDILTANIFFYPIVFVHIKSIKNEYISEKLSLLKDYPYFSLDLYKPDEHCENTEFDNDAGDRFLKIAMLDVESENKSKKTE